MTSFFNTSLNLLKSIGTGTVYQHLIYLFHFFELLKLVGFIFQFINP